MFLDNEIYTVYIFVKTHFKFNDLAIATDNKHMVQTAKSYLHNLLFSYAVL